MLKNTANEYSQYLAIDLDKKLVPIHQSVDDMLTRLEEFETLLSVVQQERCNSVGLTGSLNQALDSFGELQDLCNRVDTLEKLVSHIKSNVDTLEKKVVAAEEQFGLTDNTARIKHFLTPLFKKSISLPEQLVGNETEIFSTEQYFITKDSDEEQSN